MKQMAACESAAVDGHAIFILTRRVFGGSLLATIAMAGTGCAAQNTEYPAYRYRLTVEVDTPEGVRTGSSVIEVRTFKIGPESLAAANGIVMKISGEAVRVDLGKRGSIYALLRSAQMQEWAHRAMLLSLPSPFAELALDEKEQPALFKQLLGKVFVVPRWLRRNGGIAKPSGYPLLARFHNEQDSTTIEELNPDDLSEQLGPGVRLRRMTVEITNDHVTSQISNFLPWLRANYPTPMNINHDPLDYSIASSAHHFDFIRVNS